MKAPFCMYLCLFLASHFAMAEPSAAEQFRKHITDADTNKDGFVTKEELTIEIAKDNQRDVEHVTDIAKAMMHDLDADHDGRISVKEAAVGAQKVAENALMKLDISKAKKIMAALADYAKKHDGASPVELKALVKDRLIHEDMLVCTMPDGHEKSWIYNKPGEESVNDTGAAIICSPGAINGQYIIGTIDGDVIGIQDDGTQLEKSHGLRVYPDRKNGSKGARTEKP